MTHAIALFGCVVGIFTVAVWGLLLVGCRRRVPPDAVLLVNRIGHPEPLVSFRTTLVFPLIHLAEEMNVSMHSVAVEALGRDALTTRDGSRVDMRALFRVRVRRATMDIVRVARTLGCSAAGDPKRIQELFAPKFLEALYGVAIWFEAEELRAKERERFGDEVLAAIGMDLNGF
ncbi:MAG: hypothetical protein HOW73_04585, partial [Polyangiaceae bacterium]|nr:hypothetical protein [Polyangiaceae bacterium]